MQADLSFRVGQGFDVHAFAEGRDLIIGGVRIEHARGLLGHSDADVLAHAITDALLGAARLGDIGRHFPDTDAAWKDADSIELLRAVTGLLERGGWGIVNIDATIIAQAPKMAPHLPAMVERLAGRWDRARADQSEGTTRSARVHGSCEGIRLAGDALIAAV